MKGSDQFVEFRIHLSRFVELTDSEFARVMQSFTLKRLKKDQVLIRAGDVVKNTYWNSKGLLTSTFTNSDGKEHIIQFANEGCWITDQNAFYNRTKATFNIVAIEDSELLSISYDNREKLCATLQKMGHFFRKKANDSFTKQQSRLLTYLTSDSEKRYDLFIQEYPTLTQRLSKKRLAAYLGVSRETLSRFGKKSTKSKK